MGARIAIPLLLVVALASGCGGDPDPDPGPATEPGGGTAAPTEPGPTADDRPEDDRAVLERLAEEVAGEQRPGEFLAVADVTLFDDPEGCPSGEAAFVSIELSGQPDRGEILFCRVEAPPGWELSQGILYGE